MGACEDLCTIIELWQVIRVLAHNCHTSKSVQGQGLQVVMGKAMLTNIIGVVHWVQEIHIQNQDGVLSWCIITCHTEGIKDGIIEWVWSVQTIKWVVGMGRNLVRGMRRSASSKHLDGLSLLRTQCSAVLRQKWLHC